MPVSFLTEAERRALSQFPATLTESDLIQYFLLSPADLAQVQRQRRAENRLGFALQLCTLRYLGFCPDDLQQAPHEVVAHLAQQLNVQASDLAQYAHRDQTRTEHLQQVQTYLGFRDPQRQDFKQFAQWLLERAMEHDKPSLLFQLTAEKLYRDKIVRPGVTVIERMVASARTQATLRTYRLLKPLLTRQRRTFLDQLLQPDGSLKMTRLAWLRRPATANSPAAIQTAIAKIQYLRAQQVQQWDLSLLNPNRLKFLAQIAKKATNQRLARMPPERRYPILVAFVQQMLIEITDESVDLFARCLAETHSRARRELQAFRQQEAVAINEKVMLLQQIGQVILNPAVADLQVRPDIFAQVAPEQLQKAVEDCPRLIRPAQDESYDFLARRYSYIRRFAPAFLETFTFHSNLESDPLLNAAAILRQLNATGKRSVPADAPIDFVSSQWQPFLWDAEGQIQRRYYELCVLWELRSALRAGNVWIEGSRRYANPQTYLIGKSHWAGIRTEVYQMLGMPEAGEERIKALSAKLDCELEQFNEVLQSGVGIRLENEQLIVSPLSAEMLPDSVKALQSLVTKCLPLVDLTDLMIEVDSWTQFSQFFAANPDPDAQSADSQVYLYAALLAQACNLGASAMAQVADLSYDRLLWHTHWHLDDQTFTPANTALVNYHYRLPLVQIWGGGTLSSSDGQRFPVAVKNTQAAALPRYFGYGRGVTFYTWTSDQFSQYGNKVIPATARDATYLLDGILDNETDLTILEHTTDTAGYTEVIFALFDLLGLSFAPRIRDVGDQQLYRGESIHALRRFLLFARQGELRRHKPENLANQSNCLTVVTNAVIVWNTIYMSAVLDYLRQEGYPISEEDVAHLSPARFDHINPYGKYRFDLAQNQSRKGLRPLRPL